MEKRAEIETAAKAEIERCRTAVEAATEGARQAGVKAAEEAEAARLAEGRLAEARDAADRAVAARVLVEQSTGDEIARLVAAAEQAEQAHRRELAEAMDAAREASVKAAGVADTLRAVQGQLAESQRFAERQATARALAEQEVDAVKQAHDAAMNEVERVRRALARAQEKPQGKPEIIRVHAETTRPAGRKSLAAVPAVLPPGLPEVETVKPETVALVLTARAANPDAKNSQLSAITGISDRTIRKVLNSVPAETAALMAG